ncbi:hypothetical protein NDU88_001669 [Pleurodeles waltl]|uniref:Uncharacterized protein n=1 Tax=Pleurodeles waltl TaxID=8319 RepID=A0AAV7LAF5_PLEWA|nr:hypothetical protein NDU88_001669 [Pleurodeles waltl]
MRRLSLTDTLAVEHFTSLTMNSYGENENEVRSPTILGALHLHKARVSMCCVPPTADAPPQDKLDLILQEICESQLSIELQMGALATDVSFLKEEHRKPAGRVKTSETTFSVLEPANEMQATKINNLLQQVEQLCILGMPEGTESQ